jgi:hypothetical protein
LAHLFDALIFIHVFTDLATDDGTDYRTADRRRGFSASAADGATQDTADDGANACADCAGVSTGLRGRDKRRYREQRAKRFRDTAHKRTPLFRTRCHLFNLHAEKRASPTKNSTARFFSWIG